MFTRDVRLALFRRVALLSLGLLVSENTSGTATNLSSPFRAYICTAYVIAPSRDSPPSMAKPPETAAMACWGPTRARSSEGFAPDFHEKAKKVPAPDFERTRPRVCESIRVGRKRRVITCHGPAKDRGKTYRGNLKRTTEERQAEKSHCSCRR